MRSPTLTGTALCAVLTLMLAGCAVADKHNRRLLNEMDASMVPASPAGRWALSPVTLPAGLIALLLDAVMIHPASAIDDAWADTDLLLWTPRDESPLRRAVLTPFMATATPFVFLGSWLGRCLLPIPPHDDPVGRDSVDQDGVGQDSLDQGEPAAANTEP